MSSQIQLFSDIEPMLLHYKNTNALTRRGMLLDALSAVQKLSGHIISKGDAKEHYKVLCYTATLINYADVLNRIENQQFLIFCLISIKWTLMLSYAIGLNLVRQDK